MLLIPASNKKQLIILGILGLFLLGVVIYSNILHAPFVYDDYSSIIENESIRSLTESLKNISSTGICLYLVLRLIMLLAA